MHFSSPCTSVQAGRRSAGVHACACVHWRALVCSLVLVPHANHETYRCRSPLDSSHAIHLLQKSARAKRCVGAGAGGRADMRAGASSHMHNQPGQQARASARGDDAQGASQRQHGGDAAHLAPSCPALTTLARARPRSPPPLWLPPQPPQPPPLRRSAASRAGRGRGAHGPRRARAALHAVSARTGHGYRQSRASWQRFARSSPPTSVPCCRPASEPLTQEEFVGSIHF